MKKEANVIIIHCNEKKIRDHGKIFGARVEKQNGDWVRTWAFPIQESTAKKEGYDKTKLTGTFSCTNDYPGCPYCGGKQFWICSCGALHCWDGKTWFVTCSVCGNAAKLENCNTVDILGGGY
ncbi:MAG: TerY-C metal binding domain-containing protein [Planctomycetia bacterium]|nr:TerY-C metal binding domain-containing protein [Planctomycetia bacterium]